MKMTVNKTFDWKVFFALWFAAIFAAIAVLPYALALQSGTGRPLPPVLQASPGVQILRNIFVLGVSTAAGLLLAKRIGLGAPILEAWFGGESTADKIRAVLPVSVLLGIATSVSVILLEAFIFQPAMMRELGASAAALNVPTAQPAAWMGFLASFYGGIVEEVLIRLFLLSLLAWLGSFISKTAEGKPTRLVFWIANILAAVVFGLGHLPATMGLVPLTFWVTLRAIALNGLAGILFGYLYWKRGLESTMIAHFSADIVIHVLAAL